MFGGPLEKGGHVSPNAVLTALHAHVMAGGHVEARKAKEGGAPDATVVLSLTGAGDFEIEVSPPTFYHLLGTTLCADCAPKYGDADKTFTAGFRYTETEGALACEGCGKVCESRRLEKEGN